SSGAPVSVNDVVNAMAKNLGIDVTVRHEGHVPEYIEFLSADRTMPERFGVRPTIAFDAGLERLRAHFRDQGSGIGDQGRG
ncbi:MAG: hypothetical protein ABI024_14305, partial [Vicinamibacterales bacterium]